MRWYGVRPFHSSLRLRVSALPEAEAELISIYERSPHIQAGLKLVPLPWDNRVSSLRLVSTSRS